MHRQVPGLSRAGRRGGRLRPRAQQVVVVEGSVQGYDVLGVHQPRGACMRDQLAGPAGVPDGGGDDDEQAAGAQGPLAGRPWQAGIAVRAGVTGGRAGRLAARHGAGGDYGKRGSAGAGPGGAAAGAGRRGQEHVIFRAGHGDQVTGRDRTLITACAAALA